MNKKIKTKKTLIVVLICTFITLAITVGISAYNYYGYINYKIMYLEDYFDMNDDHNLSNQEKIKRYEKWNSHLTTNEVSGLQFRDPVTKEIITDKKIVSDDAHNVNAYYEDYTLHLPKYFDVDFYISAIKSLTEDQKDYAYTLSYNFYFSNIDYNIIEDFDPQNIHMTFVNGIGDDSDEKLQEAIDETIDENSSIGIVSRICSYSIMNETNESSLAFVSIYDDARDVYEEESNDEYYIYSNPCSMNYTNENAFGSVENLTFCIYYMDSDRNNSFINIVEGTYTQEKNSEDKLMKVSDFLEKENLIQGYSNEYYQDSYNSFVSTKIIITALITFLISGVVCALFAFVWIYDYNNDIVTTKKKKK